MVLLTDGLGIRNVNPLEGGGDSECEPPGDASYLEERTYGALLAILDREPAICAECLFADPIADIAVVGSPDNQELGDEADAYEALVESVTPIAIAEAPEKGRAWLLSLEQKWFQCTVEYINDGP